MSDGKASSSAQMNSGGDLDYSVCMELYDEPKVLPCGHMLCHKCVLQLIKGAPATSSSARLVKIKCPTCRSLLSVPKNGALPTVFTMKGFVEKEKQLQAGKRALPESTENEKSLNDDRLDAIKQVSAKCNTLYRKTDVEEQVKKAENMREIALNEWPKLNECLPDIQKKTEMLYSVLDEFITVSKGDNVNKIGQEENKRACMDSAADKLKSSEVAKKALMALSRTAT
uniref:RING-type domain-containing protein n=1 Tax=Ditylenchus dipsaci TaxID=166011 RepID=A0A915DLE6_9BILA